MKALHDLSETEFAALARRAAALPDAPAAWVRAAVDAWKPAAQANPWPDLGAVLRQLVATLRFDSWALSPLAAGVRAAGGDTRQLVYTVDGRDIDLRVSPAAPGGGHASYALAGQVLGPDEAGGIELVATTGTAPALSARLDAMGEFRFDGLVAGRYRLHLQLGTDRIELPVLEIGLPADHIDPT